MTLNPLTYGVAALRRCLYPEGAALAADIPALALSILVTLAFAVLTFLIARAQASRPLDVGLA
jgi:ABC-2 type transport system permease protein